MSTDQDTPRVVSHTRDLEAERPVPSVSFVAELRSALLESTRWFQPGRRWDPAVAIAALTGVALLLLAVVVLGLLGVGPLGPD